MSQAQATAAPSRSKVSLPGEELTIEETLRVMDVARELRQRRETAEEMFHHDRVRTELRDRLMRTARVSGDNVTEAEIDTAINHYLASLNTYSDPAPGWETFLARAWIARGKIAAVLAAAAAAAGFWFFLL